MIRSFANQGTEDVFNGLATKAARRACPKNLWNVARRKLDQLDSIDQIEELRVPPGNHLEALAGKRRGQFSIRVNQQYRVCFRWTDTGPSDVQILDYH